MSISIILIIYLVGALLTYFSGRYAKITALVSSIIALGFWTVMYPTVVNGQPIIEIYPWIESLNIKLSFYTDGLTFSMLGLCAALMPIIIATVKSKKFTNEKSLFALVMFMAFAMSGTFLAADGFLYYIFWELALIPIFFIGYIWGDNSQKNLKKVMTTFFMYTFGGSLFMLGAFVYLYAQVGSFAWEDINALVLTNKEANYIFLAFFLAYGIKLPIFPLHTWQANTYEKSPAIGTMLLSGVMLKMGVYSILRWQMPLAENTDKSFIDTVIVLSIVGIIYASLIALKQNNIKRLLAYSSMAHIGLIGAAAYTATDDAYAGVIIQMLAHGLVVVGLFFIAEIIYERYQTYNLSEMGGIRRQAVKLSSLFLILLFASIGLPGTFNFVGEFTLLYSMSLWFNKNWFVIFPGLTIILGAYYSLKMFQKSMLGEENTKKFADLNSREFIVLSILAVVIIFLGVYTQPIYELIAVK